MLLVITHHTGVPSFTATVGWVGVDLFFVLSGFLISGLLYNEYKERQAIDIERFFVRRGLKIYPAFYVRFLAAVGAQITGWHGLPTDTGNYVRELLFLQNYGSGLWDHTWSLAVEEHFYIGLALLFALLVRYTPVRENPFRQMPLLFASVAIACLLLRAFSVYVHPETVLGHPHPAYFMTHTRVDSLFLRRISRLSAPFFTGNHPEHSPLFPKPCGDSDSLSLLISTPYFAPRTGRFCVVFGFTLLYLGFGGLLVLTLQIRDVFGGKTATCLRPLGACCAYIGRHSYSIYPWHLPFMLFTPVVLHKVAHLQVPTAALGAFHLLGCCAFGILFAHLIEFPVLKLRDRFFPMFPPAPKPAATPAISTVAADFPAPAKARAAGAA